MTLGPQRPVRQQAGREPTVPFGHALMWVVGAWIGTQLLGSFVSQLARWFIRSHGAGGGELDDSPFVVLPAMVTVGATLLAVALIAPQLSGVPLRRALGLRPDPPSCYFAAILGTVMLGPLGDRLMTEMQRLLPSFTLGVLPFLNDFVRQLPFAAAWPVLALLPGISEELVFRGLLQRAAPPGMRAITVSAVMFAFFHLDPHQIAGVLPLGFFLAWVGSRCGTWVTISAHVVNNTVAIIAAQSNAIDVGYGTDEPVPIGWLPPSLGLVVAACWLIVRATPPERPASRTRPRDDAGQPRDFW